MEYRHLGVACAEIVTAWGDGLLDELTAFGLLNELRETWQTHCAAVRCRSLESYRAVQNDEGAIFEGNSSELFDPRDSKITRAIGTILLGFRTNHLDVVEAEALLKELIACESSSRRAERLLADRKPAKQPASVNRIAQYTEVFADGRD